MMFSMPWLTRTRTATLIDATGKLQGRGICVVCRTAEHNLKRKQSHDSHVHIPALLAAAQVSMLVFCVGAAATCWQVCLFILIHPSITFSLPLSTYSENKFTNWFATAAG